MQQRLQLFIQPVSDAHVVYMETSADTESSTTPHPPSHNEHKAEPTASVVVRHIYHCYV